MMKLLINRSAMAAYTRSNEIKLDQFTDNVRQPKQAKESTFRRCKNCPVTGTIGLR